MRFEVGLVLLAALAGCRLPGTDGPVSRGLATSRQLSQQGLAAMERGQWEQAESVLSQAVKACPTNPDAHRAYAEALWNRGAPHQAIAELQQARQLDPEDATLYARIAEMHLGIGQLGLALRNAQEAIDLDPKLAAAWAARARVSGAVGQPAEALADYQRALGLEPGDPQLPLEIAEVQWQLGRPDRALAALQGLAERYAPGEEPQRLLYLQGLAQMSLGRPGEAVESLSRAAGRGQPTAEVLYRLAEARLLAGQSCEALQAAQQALALDPTHQASRRLVERLELARRPGDPRPR